MKVITDNDKKADLQVLDSLFQYKRFFSSLTLTHRITRIFGNLDFESSLVSLWHEEVRPSSPSSSPSSTATTAATF